MSTLPTPTPTAGKPFSANRLLHGVAGIYVLVWAVAAIGPLDFPTWALENIMVLLFVGVLAGTYRRFAFSDASYVLFAVFLCFHAYGAHYGYAHTPFGYWLQTTFGAARNPYDRVIHCAFGLLLAYPVYEILLRSAGVSRRAALWLAPSLILAGSSFFEIVEAITAETVAPGKGPDWLGGQGDEWDSQSDMMMATAGALAAMAVTWCAQFRRRKGGAA